MVRIYSHRPSRNQPSDPRLKNCLYEYRMKKGPIERQVNYAAGILHTTPMQIYRWERGTFLPVPDKITEICRYYGATFDVLWPNLIEEKANA